MFIRPLSLLLAGMSSLILVSCGSSGGGSTAPLPPPPPPPPVDLTLPMTAENAQATTVSVLEGITATVDLIDLTAIFGFPGISASNVNGFAAPASDIIVQVVQCDAGQVTVTWDDADNNMTLSTGDTFDMDFVACLFNDLNATFDGLASLTNVVVTGDPINQTAPWGFAATFDFDMLTASDAIDTVTLDGDLGFDLSTEDNIVVDSQINSTSLVVQIGANTETLSDYVLTTVIDINTLTQTLSSSGTYTSTVLDGSVDFVTMEDFVVTGDDNPSSGQLLISELQSSVLVTVIDNISVRLEVDADLDGTIDSTIVVTWAELDID